VTKTPAPLLGFNNNVRHRGRVFHIQTEDSGVKSPRIVTHLFADGGRIVKTTRTDYAEHVGQKDMAPVVRKLMKEQHKAMFISLRAGELDQLLEQVCGPLPADSPSVPPPEKAVVDAPSPSKVHASPGPIPHHTPTIGSMSAIGAQSADPVAGSGLTLSNPALRRVVPPAQPVPVAVEQSAEIAVAVLTPTGTDAPSSATARAPGGEPRKPTPPPLPPRPRQPSNPAIAPVGGTAVAATATAGPGAAPASSKGRYAAPRPTAIFNQNQPDKQTLFGESVISEQSLDEVILSYLAEDLEAK
jgi:hypothetical protein